jgi:hypothetical protein
MVGKEGERMNDYESLINGMNKVFESRHVNYDAYYFFWASLSYVMNLGNSVSIELADALIQVAHEVSHSTLFDGLIVRVLNEDETMMNQVNYAKMGHTIYDLGPLWRDFIIKKDGDALETLAALLNDYLSVLEKMRNKVLMIIEKEHENFRHTFFEQYIKSNTKAYKEYRRKVTFTIHTMIVISEFEALREDEDENWRV